jgi:type IV pilus assembly protein PilQ
MNALPKITVRSIARRVPRYLLGAVLVTGLALPLAVRAADAPPTGTAVKSF